MAPGLAQHRGGGKAGGMSTETNVVRFRPRPVKGLQPRLSDRPTYYCMTCNGAAFQITEDFLVRCLGCKSYIKNLRVEQR
jgi:hypothetical protein